jgi:serine/threonine protein kinase
MSFKEKKEEQFLKPDLDSLLPAVQVSIPENNLAADDSTLVSEAVSFLPERYEFISVLGEGGMGAVFKVRDKSLDQIFALKILRPQLMMNAAALRRFNHEGRSARDLNHPNIATVYEYGLGRLGAPYLVMEYLDGRSLESILQDEKTLSVPRLVDLCIQLADALAYAHAQGIIHRDIKPSNIVINKSESGLEILKLVDFGIAKTVMNESLNFSRTGDVIGSPCYMSPEQCEGTSVGPQADLYSLGCVMYEALAARPPFVGSNSVQTVLKHMREKPVPLSQFYKAGRMPVHLEEIVLHLIEKNTDERYQSATELRKDLEQFQNDQNAEPSFKKTSLFQKDSGKQLKHLLIGDSSLKEFLLALSAVGFVGGLIGCIYLLMFWSSFSIQDEKVIAAAASRNKTAIKLLLSAAKGYQKNAALDQQAQIMSVIRASAVNLKSPTQMK